MTAPVTVGWWAAGEAFFSGALRRLDGPELEAPSLLPGWPRRTVIAHVARNADALVNLLTWARTGKETPMYASAGARDDGIAETGGLPAGALLAECQVAARRLVAAVHKMPELAWAVEVRTAQGRVVPASEVLWMRCREVWVHAVDLDAGSSFRDMPGDVLSALVGDVLRIWQRRDEAPEVTLTSGTGNWGAGPVTVAGELPDLAAWVTGRSPADRLTADGSLPSLSNWL